MLYSQAQELPRRRLKRTNLNAWGSIRCSAHSSPLLEENTCTIKNKGKGNCSRVHKQYKYTMLFSALVMPEELENADFFFEPTHKMIKANETCSSRDKQCVAMVGVERSRKSGAGCGASQTQRRVLLSRNKYLPWKYSQFKDCLCQNRKTTGRD